MSTSAQSNAAAYPDSDIRPLTSQLKKMIDRWARSQHELVVLSAQFADSNEWVSTGASSAAHWLADIADIEPCTAREWIRIGRKLLDLPMVASAFESGELSYSKVRTLTRLTNQDNEAELIEIARNTSAAALGRAMAAWLHKNSTPEELAAHQHRQRSLKWRTEPDGMVTFTLRLPPLLAGILISFVTAALMRSRPHKGIWPTVAQQNADAFETLLRSGGGEINTEVVLHVRGDGNTLDDGTPIPDSVIASQIPESFVRALIHDSQGNPIDATNRRRSPTRRQRRLVKERDRSCVDCGRDDLLHYDHNPAYEQSRHTVTDELELRCAPCHRRRHEQETTG